MKLADLILATLLIGMLAGLGVHYHVVPQAALWLIAAPVVIAVIQHKGLDWREFKPSSSDTVEYPDKLEAIEYINRQLKQAEYHWRLDEQQPEKIHYAVRDYEYFGDKQGVEVGLVGRGYKKGSEEEYTVRIVWDWTRDHARKVDGETYSGDERTDPFTNYDPTVVQHGVQTLQQKRRKRGRGNTIYIGNNPQTSGDDGDD